jgi:4-aminobutyrate aminotransferase-like enzyme/Ser/Thr protein kinase RdoA (MazF antagonist)
MNLLDYSPTFDAAAAISLADKLYGLRANAIPLPSERDQNFLLTSESAQKFVLKIANALEEPKLLEAQNKLMTYLENRVSFCPRIVPTLSGDEIAAIDSQDGVPNFVRLLTYLPGIPLAEVSPRSPELLHSLGKMLGQLDRELFDFDHAAVHRDFHWDLANGSKIVEAHESLIADPALRRFVNEFGAQFQRGIAPLLPGLRRSVIHNDANDYNVLVSETGEEQLNVVCLIDFGDIVYSYTVGELAVALAYAVLDQPNPIRVSVQVVAGYHEQNPLSEEEIEALYGLVMMRLCMSVCLAAYQQHAKPENEYLAISQRSIAGTLPTLAAIGERVAAAAFRATCGFTSGPSRSGTMAVRRKLLPGNLKLSYETPVKIVRGWMQYLYDDEDRKYLDAYNNVAHVGHCHPRVVKAAQDQIALLNTNTRYLHDRINQYAESLTATLPPPLRVCFFVNSGSEANELALRLARAHTKQIDLIVMEHAYHGNTTTMIDISPYKHEGPGGNGPPSWVHKVPLPDTYRGLYRAGDQLAAEEYAAHVIDVIRGLPGLCGFIAESAPSVAGQIILPFGYLENVYAAVRAAGGVCIADEVQTAYGRTGDYFWAFEGQNVVPDIVVLGKPIGNGHPLGAVVTTPEIAASFDNGMEFFSTFGGNTVSCAIGLEVLDVVKNENLQSHAKQVGEQMLEGLRTLMARHEIIGDVRGSGFFLGVELVRNRKTLEPATAEAESLVNRMREKRILLGTDGPYHNVLKIRPPLPFSADDADRLIETLDNVISDLRSQI